MSAPVQIAGNFNTSLDFLRIIYPSGPWMLTAISVDKKSIDARTFLSTETEDVLAWLNLHKQKNLYYSVNRPIEDAYQKRKLSKTDVYAVYYLHVDVDPRVGEDVEREQARIHEQIMSYRIPPTIVVFSGGGYNALWRLEEPIDIARNSPSPEETIARAIDVERRNWQFEMDFSTPDHCRDVSRILRLPGTINRPNAEKIAKGRVPALSRIAFIGPANTYPYATFAATPHVSANASSSATKGRVSENIERTESLELLKIPDELRVIIAQGFDPREPGRWAGDRSSALYYVCCELVRADVRDEVILGIITDARFEISASVRDKGNGMSRYALRQVQRARDNADHPLLGEMNEKYAVILNYGATPAIMIEHGTFNEDTGVHEPLFQKFTAFRDRIKHYPRIELPSVGGRGRKPMSAFEWWTSHPRRRTFKNVTFQPGLDTPDRFNLWTGFAVAPSPGTEHELLLEHIRDVICDGDWHNFQYIVRWMARVVQQPRTQSMVALVLLGERGVGKSIFADYFRKLFEPHTFTASDINSLTGKFNAHLGECVFVVAEEAFDLRDKRHESVLKQLITGSTNAVEHKGLDIMKLPNYVHLMMISNLERVIPAGDHERRFHVVRVSAKRMGDVAYFRKLLDSRERGLPNLLHYLMTLDLTDFEVTRVPRTPELQEQQQHNLSYEHDWLLSKLDAGMWVQGQTGWRGPIRKKLLHDDYRQYLQNLGARTIRGERAFHNFVVKNLPGTVSRQMRGRDGDFPMVFEFPPLDECRREWDRARGWTTAWTGQEDVAGIDDERRGDEVCARCRNLVGKCTCDVQSEFAPKTGPFE